MDYYLGLDIGTNSIGWAVTDQNYNLLRAKGKDLWGVRLFSEGNTAEERRVHRSNRRRNLRRKLRLQLIRELFEEEIKKVDPDFFTRLDESKFWEDDKKTTSKNSLFNDVNYNDTDYFNDYPTIFHLRKALINGETNGDIRLYFLAVNQMMKRRGHFLIDGKIDNVKDITPFKITILELVNELLDESLSEELFDSCFSIILNEKLKKTEKKYYIKTLLQKHELGKITEKKLINIWNLLISGKGKIKGVFDDEETLDRTEEYSISEIILFGDKYEENTEVLEKILGYRYQLVTSLKAIYDYVILQEVLNGEEYLSFAQVERFNKHRSDLLSLKKLIRKYDKDNEVYNLLFRDKTYKTGYVSYLGYYKNKNRKEVVKRCSTQEFYKSLKEKLKDICNNNDENYKKIVSEIESENFLLKQIVSTNSVIPYQIHFLELKEILDRLENDYPSFCNIEDGVKKTTKIEEIFTFRIPYYVGPLNSYHQYLEGSNSWIIRNKGHEKESIRPWNFSKIVDEHACEEAFIKRMINECTYLPNEKVLPKSSLLYSEYMVLNELNNIKINGSKMGTLLKKDIIENLYKKNRKITLRKIRDYLIFNNYVDSDVEITGLADEIKSNMSSYIDFQEVLGENFNINMVEEIIEQITIHVGNTKLLTKKISEKYPDLTEKQVQLISNKKYKDWARFSKELLMGIKGTNNETGEINTIIGFLRETNDNFMEIMSSRYSFDTQISEIKNTFFPNRLDYKVIESLNLSPSVKKMIWQVIKVNKELIKVLGSEPKKIFIEMARGKEEKPTVKSSRQERLLQLYKTIGKDNVSMVKEIERMNESDFRNRAVFLYYTQMGRCMYSGERIDFDDIFDKNLYDLDHIIPRKLKKDDSLLNNLVLVKRNLNQNVKRDLYPLPSEIGENNSIRKLWDMLLKKGLIEQEKYNRLIRRDELTDRELAEFINRQLVETRQTTKVVKDLFENFYKSSIITVKAGLVSELRQDFEVLKCREINDLHHAHDAFLNIIVGDVWNKKFTSNPFRFVSSNRGRYTLNNIFTKKQVKKNGEIIWSVNEGKKLIIKTLNKPSVLFSSESFETTGQLFDATISGKKDYKKDTFYLPLKKDERLKNVKRYGGYKSISGAYFFLVEHSEKNKRVKSIEFVPIYLSKSIRENKITLLDYCIDELGLIEPKIIIDKIKNKTQIEVDGFRYLISGRTGKQIIIEPNQQMFWNVEDTNIFKKLFNIYKKSISSDIGDSETQLLNKKIFTLVSRLENKPYSNRINLPKINLDKVDNIGSSKKINLLENLLILSRKTVMPADLTTIGGVKSAGKTLIPKNIEKFTNFKIIENSVTGLFEKIKRII